MEWEMSVLNFSWKDHISLYFKWPTSVNDAGADGYRLSRLFRQLSFLSAKMWQPLQIKTFQPIQKEEVGRPKLLQTIFFLWIQYWWIFLFDLQAFVSRGIFFGDDVSLEFLKNEKNNASKWERRPFCGSVFYSGNRETWFYFEKR